MRKLPLPSVPRLLGFVFLTSFAVALLITGWFVLRPSGRALDAPEMRVLCAEDWIDSRVLETFAADRGVRVALYTYRDVPELLRQLANADGRVEVLCASSLLLRNLVRSRWVRRLDFAAAAAANGVSADFTHLPFDPDQSYGIPLHWSAYGFWSARGKPEGTLKALQARGRVGVWASDLNLMALLTEAGIDFGERLESEGIKRLEDDVQRFVTAVGLIPPDFARAFEVARHFDFAHVPSVILDGSGHFASGEGTGIVDVGLLAVGEKSQDPALARALIERLTSPEVALAAAARVHLGTVHEKGEADPRFVPAGRASALRRFELTKLRFPDVDAEATLKFARVFAAARAIEARR